MVARVRVNPKDCLAILECIRLMGMNPHERSWSHNVSLALSSLIVVARQGGILKKEEDGFQYLNEMQYFFDQPSTKLHREQTDNLYKRAVHGIEAPTPGSLYVSPAAMKAAEEVDGMNGLTREERAILGKEFVELGSKKELSLEEKDRFDYLNKALFG